MVNNTCTLTREDGMLHFHSSSGTIVLDVINEGIINVRSQEAVDTIVVMDTKKAIHKTEYNIEEFEDHYVFSTKQVKVKIDKNSLHITFLNAKGEVLSQDHGKNQSKAHPSYCYKVLEEHAMFFGCGERVGFLDKRGERLRFWNYAEPLHYTTIADKMYQSIPFFISKTSTGMYGIYLDNSHESFFDFGKESKEYYYFGAEKGSLNYYFIYGDDMKEIIEQYTLLTGRIPMPPMWALGYHQSRWSYYPEESVSELATTFREKGIPCDVIHLDIHYMDNYKIFTVDTNKFPNMKSLIDGLTTEGFKLITIIDPGVKQEQGYKIYEEGLEHDFFVKNQDGTLFVGDVWPGGCTFPDFTNRTVRNWWANLNQEFLELGIKGIWNDLNEPSVLVQPHTPPKTIKHETDFGTKDHSEIHNLYANYEAMATQDGFKQFDPNMRPFILSRAGFAGIQKYAAVWTGDNTSSWDHLLLSIPMLLNLGLSGLPFVGADVGGYAGDCSEELLIRWMQLGSFSPLFRNHSRKETVQQEPWAFGEKAEQIMKQFIQLRYRLLPYYYALFREAHEKGHPILRPMFFEYPFDEEAYHISDQFMVGENLLVAPIYIPNQARRAVYLPAGTWFNYWNGETYQGGQYILEETSIETIPVFVKGGSIIPEYQLVNYVGEKEWKTLTLHVYPGDGSFTFYDDDGETNDYLKSKFNITKLGVDGTDTSMTINIEQIERSFSTSLEIYHFIIHGMNGVSKVIVNNQSLEHTVSNHLLEFTVDIEQNMKVVIQ